jgi:VIT1/CCC1 family predicted Fe2+/Mn2+ transporter
LTTFAALLTLASVSITNFSSFFLGGKTEDVSDILALQNLVNFSLSDIPDAAERSKSLNLVKQLFIVLGKDIGRANLQAALMSGATTFLAGIIPILVFLLLPESLDLIISLTIVAIVVLVFLVRYRSKIAKVHWKITLFETAAIITIAVIASLMLSRGI